MVCIDFLMGFTHPVLHNNHISDHSKVNKNTPYGLARYIHSLYKLYDHLFLPHKYWQNNLTYLLATDIMMLKYMHVSCDMKQT